MKRHQNYDWILVGCHLVTEVAIAYYPNYAHDSSAVRAFRRMLTQNALLWQEITDAGYTPQTTHLTPRQIGAIVRHLGLPNYVDGMIEKNPYLAVPKIYKK